MFLGVLFAMAAGLMWGAVFVGPLLLEDYPATLQAAGRYLALGILVIPIALKARKALAQLKRQDWLEAARLTLVGNLIYYFLLIAAIQKTGAPLTTMIIGTLPVVSALAANYFYGDQDGRLSWGRLAPSLVLIMTGVVLVHQAEQAVLADQQAASTQFTGIILAILAVLCWSWFSVRNGRWLRINTGCSPSAWITVQSLLALPMALVAYLVICAQLSVEQPEFALPFGPRPVFFLSMIAGLALLCSWLAGLCWNEACQRLPTVIASQLVVFETLAGLAYAFIYRQALPGIEIWLGAVCLMAGILFAINARTDQSESEEKQVQPG